MDPLQVREAMWSKDLPDPLARILITARQMEISGEPLSDEEAPDYSENRTAADELEKEGKKELAGFLRAGIAAAEASDGAGTDEDRSIRGATGGLAAEATGATLPVPPRSLRSYAA